MFFMIMTFSYLEIFVNSQWNELIDVKNLPKLFMIHIESSKIKQEY